VLRGLEHGVAARYPSMDALLAALDADPGRRLRRIAVIATGVLGVAGVVAASAMWRTRTVVVGNDPCLQPAPLAGTWDPVTRVRVRAGFVASGAPSADEDFTRATTALDESTSHWVLARKQICADTRERHTVPETMMQLRLSCLDRQKDNLEALVALLEHPDSATVKQSVRAIHQLSGPNECAQGRATFVDPPAAAIAPKVAELRKRLSHAYALRLAARTNDAIAELQPLATEARKLDYGPLLAEVLYALSVDLSFNADFNHDAIDDEAERVAIASHADDVAARIATKRYWLGSLTGKDESTLREWRSHARDWAQREGDLEAKTNYEAGAAFDSMQHGDYGGAFASYERAIPLASQLYGTDSLRVLGLQQDRALLLAVRGRYEEAAASQKALNDQLAQVYGEDSNDLAQGLDNYGTTLVWLGRYDEARTVLQRAIKIPSLSEIVSGILKCDLARVFNAEGKFDDAIARCSEGVRVLRQRGGGINLAINEDPLAAGYLGARQYEAALTQSRECLTEYRKARQHDDADMVLCIAVEGTALVELGKPQDARVVLEHALELQGSQPASPGVVANLEYQLARALAATKQDLPRARELATKAHDELAKIPFKKSLLDELDAWRAKHAAELR
jgi:Tfp pilus assembly protein PilF